jgi:hypothetical protein
MPFFGLGAPQEQKTQFYIRDDSSCMIRKLPFEDSCLVEKKDGKIDKAWKHFYASEFQFKGYRDIKGDMVTLAFGRDFILDPFNRVPETANSTGGKPKRNDKDIREWTSEVAESQRYKVMNKPGNTLLIEKITMWLGIGLIILLLLFGAKMAFKW